MTDAPACRCNRSLGAISAIFASLAAMALLAQDRCLDAGGRVSDAAWVCEVASGGTVALWSFVSPVLVGVVALVVGVPVYFAVNAIGDRWMASLGARRVAQGRGEGS